VRLWIALDHDQSENDQRAHFLRHSKPSAEGRDTAPV